MIRSVGLLTVSIALWLAMAGTAAGQAAVEAGLGAAGSATGAASARSIGKSISGIGSSLDKALKAGQPPSDAKAVAGAKTESPSKTPPPEHAAPAPPANWEDPSGIDVGLTYPEMVRRFGPPILEITGETGKSIVYSGKSGAFHIEMQDEQVTAVRKPASRT